MKNHYIVGISDSFLDEKRFVFVAADSAEIAREVFTNEFLEKGQIEGEEANVVVINFAELNYIDVEAEIDEETNEAEG